MEKTLPHARRGDPGATFEFDHAILSQGVLVAGPNVDSSGANEGVDDLVDIRLDLRLQAVGRLVLDVRPSGGLNAHAAGTDLAAAGTLPDGLFDYVRLVWHVQVEVLRQGQHGLGVEVCG